ESRIVEEVVDEVAERPGLSPDAPGELAAAVLGPGLPVFREQVAEALDRSRRRAQLVGDGAEKRVLQRVELAQSGDGLLLALIERGVADGHGEQVGEGVERLDGDIVERGRAAGDDPADDSPPA